MLQSTYDQKKLKGFIVTITTTADDNLSLDLVKQSLYIDNIDDDVLLSQHISASLEVVEEFCNANFIHREWESEAHELKVYIDATMRLSLPADAKTVTITDDSGDIVLDRTKWYFVSDGIFLNLFDIDVTGDITKVIATTGIDPIQASVNQSRLLLIGSWYGSREETVIGTSATQLPSGAVQLLMPLLQEVAI